MKLSHIITSIIIWAFVLASISFGSVGWIEGKTGNALLLDGLDDYVDVPAYKGVLGTQSRTCSAWIKTTSVQQGSILSWGAEQNGQKWVFRVESNGSLAVGVWGGYINTTATVNDGQWHHVAAVVHDDGSPDVSEILLYVDGVLQSTTVSNLQLIDTISSQEVMIGAYQNAGVPIAFFNGLMDDVRIYSRALGLDEMNPQAPVPTEGLIAHWAMDETEGTIAHDTVSGYDGILRNIQQKYSGGSGMSDDPYQIATKADLLTLAGDTSDNAKCFILTADIDLEGAVFTNAIIAPGRGTVEGSQFSGVFDGRRHKITNFIIKGGSQGYLGLFSCIGQGGRVEYLGIDNFVIYGNWSYVGGLAGYNNKGNITCCYATGRVEGGEDVGGLIGYNQGDIVSCYATGSVCGGRAGGLVGINAGSIYQCYSRGYVYGDYVYGNYSGGGLVGLSYNGIVKNSFWDTQTSHQTSSAGGTGKTTAEMNTVATFTGMDWVEGVRGNALYFDGIYDYVKMQGYYGVGGSGARTISMWIKPVAKEHDQALVQWGEDADGQLWIVFLLPDGTVKVAAYNGAVQSSKPISFNQWHHIIVMLDEGQTDSGKIRLYIDGQSQGVSLANHCVINTSLAVPVHLGAWYRSSTGELSNYFCGLMDDVCIYERVLNERELVSVCQGADSINRWAFDESHGDTAHDSAGFQDGRLHMTVSGWVQGRTGNALAFDGMNDYVEVSGYKGIAGSGPRTCTAWIKTAGTQQGNIISWGADQNGQKWMFRVESNGSLAVGVWGGYIHTTATVNDGQWHQVATVVHDDGSPDVGEIRLYIDGILQSVTASGTQPIDTVASEDVMFGAVRNAGIVTGCFNGILDDVCIYDRALESSEIALKEIVANGLVGCWEMNESGGTLVSDSTGRYNGIACSMDDNINPHSGWTEDGLIFDGVDDYVDVEGYKGIAGTQSRTCSAWIKTSGAQQGTIISWGTDQNGQKWTFRVEGNGTLAVGVWGGYITTTKAVNNNQWHHVVAVLEDDGSPDVSEIQLYVDGVPQGTVVSNTRAVNTVATQDVMIGAVENGGIANAFFNGVLDDVCIYNRALDGNEIAPVSYADSPVNHWKLDEVGGLTANDSAGTGHGVLHNMTDDDWVYGRTGNALVFDGTDDYIDIPDHFGIGGAHARTVSLWVKTSAGGRNQALVQWGSDAKGQLWMLAITEDNKAAAAAFDGRVSSVQSITDGQWHHIAAILDEGQTDSSRIRLYVDGKPEAVPVGVCTVNTAQTVPIHLGAWYVASSGSVINYYSGQMDDVCIYNRAVPIDEIYSGNAFADAREGLTARWRMDETAGDIAHDSISDYHGTLNCAGWDFSPSSIDGDPQDWIIPTEGADYPIFEWQILSRYHGGTGTVNDPYRIADRTDILALAESPWDWNDQFILTADIDMGGMVFTRAIIAKNTVPGGTWVNFTFFDGTPFTGAFDGNGHSISNFVIQGGSNDYLGLFGYVGLTGQIKNLGLEDFSISGVPEGDNRPYYMGLLAGFNAGTISQCYTEGTVSGYYDVGGLVGINVGQIINCYNAASVTGYYDVGGLVGSNYYNPSNLPINDGNNGTILMCYSTGAVTGFYDYIGGLVGLNGYSTGTSSAYDDTILACYWDIQASGQTTSTGGTGKTTAEMKTRATYTGIGWVTDQGINALYFDGLNSYVDVPAYKGVLGTQSRTCSAWIKTTSVQQGSILSWGAEQNGQKWVFRVESNGSLAVGVWGGYINTTATVNDGQWHHVAAVVHDDGSPDVSEILLYVDGVLQSTTVSNLQSIDTIASQDVMIGVCHNAGVPTAFFNGLMDDVCIYGRALGLDEMNPQAPIPTEGLIAHWAMDETEGFIVHDTVSFYDGILQSMWWDFVNETADGANNIWRMCADGVNYPRLNWESIEGDFVCSDGVNMEDLDYFVGRWMVDNCTSSNNYCGGADVDRSGNVDLADWAVLAQHWLEGV